MSSFFRSRLALLSRRTALAWGTAPLVLAVAMAYEAVADVPVPPGASQGIAPAVWGMVERDGQAVVLVNLKGVDVFGRQYRRSARTSIPTEYRRSLRSVGDRVAEALRETGGGRIRYRFSWVPSLLVEIRSRACLETLEGNPDVSTVQLDVRGRGALRESAPFIRAPETHAMGYDGRGSVVAVLDTGVSAHPALAGAIIHEYHFLDHTSDRGPGAADGHGHGTSICGVIASRGQNAPTGIAPGCHLVVVKVLDDDSTGWLSDWIAGIDHVLSLHHEANGIFVDVVNLSVQTLELFAGTCDSEALARGDLASLFLACRTAMDTGITVLAASGNDSSPDELPVPACFSTVIAVGSTMDTPPDRVSDFTNRSPKLDLLAPGESVVSTGFDGGVSVLDGTSHACAHAAAAAAILRQARRSLSPADIRQLLVESARPYLDVETGLELRILDVRSAVAATSLTIETLECSSSPAVWTLGEEPPVLTATWTPPLEAVQTRVRIVQAGRQLVDEVLDAAQGSFRWISRSPGDFSVHVRATDERGTAGLEAFCEVKTAQRAAFRRGECNGALPIDISDSIFLLEYLFLGLSVPECADPCDMNGDGLLDISDSIYLLRHIFTGGSPPPPPFEACQVRFLQLGCRASICP